MRYRDTEVTLPTDQPGGVCLCQVTIIQGLVLTFAGKSIIIIIIYLAVPGLHFSLLDSVQDLLAGTDGI